MKAAAFPVEPLQTLDQRYHMIDSILRDAIEQLKPYTLNPAARWLLIDLYFARKRLREFYEMLKGGAV